jgi:hypothetical protein
LGIGFTINDQQLQAVEDVGKQLQHFHSSLSAQKQCETYIKCLMGRNLTQMRVSTKMKGQQFVQHVQQYLPKSYSKSEMYFLMDLHKTAVEYHRLMYVTIPMSELKSKFNLVKQLLSDK